MLATRFGGKAVELLVRGELGMMVANHPPDIVAVPLAEIVVGKNEDRAARLDLLADRPGDWVVTFGD